MKHDEERLHRVPTFPDVSDYGASRSEEEVVRPRSRRTETPRWAPTAMVLVIGAATALAAFGGVVVLGIALLAVAIGT